jgi:hypothetical protein
VRPIATLEPWRPGLSSPALPRTSLDLRLRHPMLVDMRCPSLRIDVKAKSHVLSQPRRLKRRLTVKLRGRTTTPDRHRGPIISPGTRGLKQTTLHGPLQRLLGLSNRRNRHLETRYLYRQLGALPRRRIGRKPLQILLIHALKILLVR